MPWKIAGPCHQSGCPERAIRGGYCQAHQRQRPARQVDQDRPSAAARGYDARWRAFRRGYLQRFPECVICNRMATEIDHIIPIRRGGALYDECNLQAMCHECHSRKTARENGGWGRAG